MGNEQKQRAMQILRRFEQANPMTRQADNATVDMAALLHELIEQPTAVPVLTVECEPDYWSGGHYHEGTLPHIDPTAVWKLPIGTKLYTAPVAPMQSTSVPDGWKLVPVEPTPEMVDAAQNAGFGVPAEWAAMLAAAPVAPELNAAIDAAIAAEKGGA